MKKIFGVILVVGAVIMVIVVIFYIYWPFAQMFFHQRKAVGDALMHISNIISIQRDHPFPILAWKSEWAGYPLVEGYPWLHYYLVQPFLPLFANQGVAIDFYSAIFLLLYYVVSFLLLFYVSKNLSLALFFTVVLIFGADSQMPFTINAYMTFTASMFFLPLILLLTIVARNRSNNRILVMSSILLSLAFYAHGAMTGIVIFPVLIPLLLHNKEGKITKESLLETLKYFLLFALLSSIQIYQFISYNAQGYLRGVKPFPLSDIPARAVFLFSWINPILLPLLAIFLVLLFISLFKNFTKIKPLLISFILLFLVFVLMVLNITSMNLVLLAERVLWGLSLVFLLLFAKVVRELMGSNFKKSVVFGLVAFVFLGGYLYTVYIVKPPHLIPDTISRSLDPYKYNKDCITCTIVEMNPNVEKYANKYDYMFNYPQPSWSNNFDNYRTDGISWAIYSNWNIWSSNPRYKGRFPAAKGLPLEWSGLVTAAEYGRLGEAGTFDNSEWAINQTLFFFDWYAIRYIELGEGDSEAASYLRKEPLITNSEITNDDVDLNDGIVYHSIDKKYIGPIYAPTEVKTMAVVSPEKQYDNFIRTLSYSNLNSQRVIPIYLGSSLGALNKSSLKYFDALFLYGYKKSIFAPNIWETLYDYVKNGGKLIIETGQKVPETQIVRLPEVFPIKATNMEVIEKPWNVEIKNNDLTGKIAQSDFTPLKTKYSPYAISEAKPGDLKNWAQPVLAKDGNIVMAYGQLGQGSVVWSGLNLPFHAIDNRNTSETVIFANILNWFFPKTEEPVANFQVDRPNPENIIVRSNQGKGVLFKENYSSGWSARLNGKATKIYKAGLFEMYIPFNSQGENEVGLSYRGIPLHWALFSLSTVTFIGVLAFIFFKINPLSLINKLYKNKNKSDEEDY